MAAALWFAAGVLATCALIVIAYVVAACAMSMLEEDSDQ